PAPPHVRAGRGGGVFPPGAPGQRPRPPPPGPRRSPVSRDTRPDRHALLELQALLTQLAALRDEGDPARFSGDSGTAGCCTGCGLPLATRPWPTPRPPASRCAPTAPWPTSMTCATTWPTPGSPTSTRA